MGGLCQVVEFQWERSATIAAIPFSFGYKYNISSESYPKKKPLHRITMKYTARHKKYQPRKERFVFSS